MVHQRNGMHYITIHHHKTFLLFDMGNQKLNHTVTQSYITLVRINMNNAKDKIFSPIRTKVK